MPYLKGFVLNEKIFENKDMIIYKGTSEKDGQKVFLKLPGIRTIRKGALHNFQKEYLFVNSTNDPAILRIIDFIPQGKTPVLIMEYFEGQYFQTLSENDSLNIRTFLRVAVNMANTLARLYVKDIVYNGIAPSGVMMNLETGQIKLTDFSKAFRNEDHNNKTDREPSLQNLQYLSPEGIGRINCKVDFRSDLYSLGIFFYHLLAGYPPFYNKDPLEVIHAHLAIKPTPLSQVNKQVPLVLSNIVDKLLEKKKEDRYQTAYGLREDLYKCLDLLKFEQNRYVIDSFPLAEKDVAEDFRLTGHLYNRDKELEELKNAFNRVVCGGMEIVFVSGHPGTGKTSLSQKLLDYTGENNAVCSSGKFDQNNRDVPYAAFVQSLQSIIRKILMEDEPTIDQWREKIITALAPNTQIMVDIIPELKIVVGLQPRVEKLSPLETLNRFDAVFLKFLQLFGVENAPLVLLLDDLQWADYSSIRLLEQIMLEKNVHHLMILGTYRNNEINESHPLTKLFAKMQENSHPVRDISLNPLEITHVNQLIGEIFHCESERSMELAQVCMSKTKGNPFFLIQFLSALKEDQLISFDRYSRRWVWDIEGIIKQNVTANVVDSMINKINRLPVETIEILQYAACINNCFDLHTLSIVAQMGPEEIENHLRAAVEAGLIVVNDNSCSFLHDRIQQAAYAILNNQTRRHIHYQIGRLLFENLDARQRETRLFEIADHYNQGEGCITGKKEMAFWLEINLRAGRKAKEMSDFPRALEYFTKALDLFENTVWETDYHVGLELHIEAAETAYGCADYSLMEKITAEVLPRCREIPEKARLYEIIIEAYTAQNKLEKALEASRHILAILGIDIPKKPGLLHIFLEYAKIRMALRNKKLEELSDLPVMTNINHIKAMRIIVSIGIASYSSSPYAFLLFVLKGIELSLKHGITVESAVAYASYGSITTMLKNADLGYNFFKLAFQTHQKFGVKKYDSVIKVLFNMMAWHWKDVTKLKEFPDAYQSGIAVGDLLPAGHSLMQYFVYSYLLGKELPLIETDIVEYYDKLLRTGHDTSIRVSEIYLQAVFNLKGSDPEPTKLTGRYFDETALLRRYQESNDRTVVFTIYFHKLILSYHFGHYKEALAYLAEAKRYLDGVQGTICVPLTDFYGSLILAANVDEMGTLQKYFAKRKIKKSVCALERLARSIPGIFLNKLFLLKAEQARIHGNFFLAGEYYDKSIELAAKNRFFQEEALANESAGRFYLSLQREIPARLYIRHANMCYRKWGAYAKSRDIQKRYAECLHPVKPASEAIQGRNINDTKLPAVLSDIDLFTVIKMSQVISQEIVLEDLLKLLVNTMLQYSGARRVVFVMNYDNRLTIEAEGSTDQSSIRIMQGVPLENGSDVPSKLIGYVARTGETIILNGEQHNSQFNNDEYLANHRPKSFLCLPVAAKGRNIGVFYLENNLIEGLFKNDLLDLLQLLSSQIAISLDNANLYKNLENIIEAHTKELKEKNNELRETNKLLAVASEAKTRFVANVSHEIRTPLQGIIGMTDLICKTREYNENYISMIQSSADMLTKIINDILDIAKIESDRLDFEEKVFNLQLLLQHIAHNFKELADKRKIGFVCTVSPDLPDFLLADAYRIRQILNNLLTNAIRYTEEGTVELSVLVAARREGMIDVQFMVRDTGMGIPADKLETIFENFTQLETIKSGNSGGTGLGLAIVKKLVELMDGKLSVESSEGKGSIFTCLLPLKTVPQQEAATMPHDAQFFRHEKEDLQGLKIIAAEDNEINRIYIEKLLQYYNCDVTVVEDGTQLLQQLKISDYDCALLDKNMPDTDGIETVRIIRKLESQTGKHLPIIAITASAIAGDKEVLLAEGMDYYLSKPIRGRDLLIILKDIQQRKTTCQNKGTGNTERLPVLPGKPRFIDVPVLREEAELFGKEAMLGMMEGFIKDYKKQLEKVAADLQTGDFAELEKSSHKLAGSISCFYAETLYKAAGNIEQHARNRNSSEAHKAYAEMAASMESFVLELVSVKKELEA